MRYGECLMMTGDWDVTRRLHQAETWLPSLSLGFEEALAQAGQGRSVERGSSQTGMPANMLGYSKTSVPKLWIS